MRVGSLCTGIAGIELGLEYAGIDIDPVFVADIEPAVCDWLAETRPHIPNIGDITAAEFPDVDLIVAGFPCQPVSTAGRRAGTDDERWLFDDIADAVGRMGTRPDLFLENVPGLLTANGGDAMARVVHRLAGLGYLFTWGTLTASAVGACHRRNRWFCVATHPDSGAAGRVGRTVPGAQEPVDGWGDLGFADGVGVGLLATPTAWLGRRPSHSDARPGSPALVGTGSELTRDIAALLPTPTARDSTNARNATVTRRADSAAAYGWTMADVAHRLAGRPNTGAGGFLEYPPAPANEDSLDLLHASKYGPAVKRWERLCRPAPAPLDDGRLAPQFVEWMQGYPAGWVTDTAALGRRTAALKALGNSVVPQCVAAAYLSLSARLAGHMEAAA